MVPCATSDRTHSVDRVFTGLLMVTEAEDALGDLEDTFDKLVSTEQAVARYEGLISLWSHRDAVMHQWPPLIISASAAIMAFIFSQKTSAQLHEIASPANWGQWDKFNISVGTGIPMLMSGLLVLPFLYGMIRAIKIMDNFARQLCRIETECLNFPVHCTFSTLNHPGGWSSRRLILRVMAVVSFTQILLGSLITFGYLLGPVFVMGVMALSLAYFRSDR